MKYKSVVATRRGGPEVLEVIENDLREPAPGEARIRVLAAGVSRTNINYRYGYSPLAPKAPFVPGYQVVGQVDALGAGFSHVAVGERVAALIGHGGYTEMLYLGSEHLAPVPDSIDPAEAAIVVFNYVSAQQMLQRVARVKAGDKVLVIGASGGVLWDRCLALSI
jgi:NADPH:quinone reductase-like Zn-dependent oxidoreductase